MHQLATPFPTCNIYSMSFGSKVSVCLGFASCSPTMQQTQKLSHPSSSVPWIGSKGFAPIAVSTLMKPPTNSFAGPDEKQRSCHERTCHVRFPNFELIPRGGEDPKRWGGSQEARSYAPASAQNIQAVPTWFGSPSGSSSTQFHRTKGPWFLRISGLPGIR